MGAGASVFAAALQQRHAEEMQRMTQEAAAHHAVLTSYLGGGPVAQQEALAAMRGLGKGFPKEHQKEWNKHVDALELSLQPQNKPAPPGDGAKPQTLSPAGVQPNAPGLPAPPSASDSLGAETGGTPPPFASSAPASLPQPPAQAPPAPSTPPAAPIAPQPQAQPQGQPQAQPQPPAAAPRLPVVPPSPVSEGSATPGILPPASAAAAVQPSGMTPPPYTEPGGLLSPVDMARRKAETDRIGAQAGVGIAQTTARGTISVDDMKAQALRARMGPEYDKLSPLQKAQLLSGHPLTMDYRSKPGTGFSKPGDVLADGSPAPGNAFGRWEMYNGMEVFRPMSGPLKATPITDASGTVTQVLHDNAGQVYDQNGPTGKLLSSFKGVNPALMGTNTSLHSEQNLEGGMDTSRTVKKVLPGGAAVSSNAPAGNSGAPGSLKSLPAPPGTAGGASGSVASNPSTPLHGGLQGYIRPFGEGSLESRRVDMVVANAAAKGLANLKALAINKKDLHNIELRMTELGIDPNNITTSMLERANNAKLVMGHIQDITNIINEAERKGELGVVATRWNDWLTNKLGDDPTPDHIFSKLSGNQGFLSTAVAMAHGGLRGGASPQMVEHWEKALSAKDGGTLKAKLGEAMKWMGGYAAMVPDTKDVADKLRAKTGGGITPPPSADVPRSYKSTATGPGGHKIGSDDGQTWFDVQTGKPI